MTKISMTGVFVASRLSTNIIRSQWPSGLLCIIIYLLSRDVAYVSQVPAASPLTKGSAFFFFFRVESEDLPKSWKPHFLGPSSKKFYGISKDLKTFLEASDVLCTSHMYLLEKIATRHSSMIQPSQSNKNHCHASLRPCRWTWLWHTKPVVLTAEYTIKETYKSFWRIWVSFTYHLLFKENRIPSKNGNSLIRVQWMNLECSPHRGSCIPVHPMRVLKRKACLVTILRH